MYSNGKELSEMENLERLGSIILSCVKLNEHWDSQDLKCLLDYINKSRLPSYMVSQISDEIFNRMNNNNGVKNNEN